MLRFKVDVIPMLKERGYTTYRIRKEHIISEGSMQRLRDHRAIDWTTIETVCRLLDCQPGDFLEYIPDAETTENR